MAAPLPMPAPGVAPRVSPPADGAGGLATGWALLHEAGDGVGGGVRLALAVGDDELRLVLLVARRDAAGGVDRVDPELVAATCQRPARRVGARELEHGADLVRHLAGMYAIAVWDTRSRTLFLSRDRLGIKPLYYARGPDWLVFGSEIKALLAHPRVR